MFHEEIEPAYSEKEEESVGTSVLGKRNVVSHEGEGEGTGQGNTCRELSGEEVDHWDRKGSKDERNNPNVLFWFCKWVE